MVPDHVYTMVESCLKELSDIDFQRRIWVRGEGPEVSSFEEAVCQLFDDTSIGDQLDEGQEVVLSPKLDSILRELKHLLNKIDYRMTAEEILNHPNWDKIRQLSIQALSALRTIEG